ncbi:D-glycero-beta-D-manno-heptose-7-phosphate kinase, partial [uncultured Pseudoalteromonas sp.]|uniref:D-glycero-beta-D-manno-heptose-7-phosphate kinase n=1 Tax=uncultured Pseudoalteromonas sp. TaxID=114053 RepID=UPI0025E4F0C1
MLNLLGKAPKILVIGDLIVDHYLWGSSDRISPEAPVLVVSINNESRVLGGAGNVINNLKALNAKVDVMSVLGECGVSSELKLLLNEIEIDTQYLITEPKRISSKKTRIIAAQQQVVRYDQENSTEITETSQKTLLSNFRKRITDYDCVLLSDYGKGVLTNELTQQLIKTAKQHSVKILVDPKGLDYAKYKGAYLLTPNKKEAREATGINITDDASLACTIKQLKEEYELDVSLITLSEQGVAIYDGELRNHPTQTREVFDVTGAGDTVLASLGFALSCKLDIDEAVKFANLAAGVVVGKIGSATATLNEIIEYESSLNKSSSDEHIKTLNEIAVLSEELRARGKKIVFTNGCFDLLHAGHVKYLETAKSFGDVLIVGLNSDQSVSTLKGNNRPINMQVDRAYLLAALEAVDYVVIFDEDTPYNLIKAIK